MSAEILANSDETRSNLRESVSMGAYTLDQVKELATRAVLLAGEAFKGDDLKEAESELRFAADLLAYVLQYSVKVN